MVMNKWLVELVDLDRYCSLTDTLTFSDFLQTFLGITNSSWHTALIFI